MTDRDFEAEARAAKVETIVRHLQAVHEALPPRLPIQVWAAQSKFPFVAMARAAGVRPPSELTKQMVLEELAS